MPVGILNATCPNIAIMQPPRWCIVVGRFGADHEVGVPISDREIVGGERVPLNAARYDQGEQPSYAEYS